MNEIWRTIVNRPKGNLLAIIYFNAVLVGVNVLALCMKPNPISAVAGICCLAVIVTVATALSKKT